MKAAYYEGQGPAREVLRIGEVETPKPGRGEVLVRLRASGVNPSDVKSRQGLRAPMAFPRVVPHSDGAGTIAAVGDGVGARHVGESVYLWNAQWGRAFGTAAEYVCLPTDLTTALPPNLSFEEGACLGIPAMTAHRCVFADGPVGGQTILVTGGAGAVGHYAIQLAKWGGATVIATVSGPEKAARARESGADHVINYREEDVAARVLDLTGGEGVHRIVEVDFGGNLAATLPALRVNGVIAAYASMGEPEPKLPFYALMFKSATLRMPLVYQLPTDARTEAIRDLWVAAESGTLSCPIGARFDLSHVAEAHEAVESGRVAGHVVVAIP